MKQKNAAGLLSLVARLSGVYGMIAVVILWYVLSASLGARLIPLPHRVVWVLLELVLSGQLLLHAGASLLRLTTGILAALIVAVPVGIWVGVSRPADTVLSPVVYVLYPVPKIAFLPVFMVLFGLGDTSKVLLLFSVILFQLIIAARDGVREIPAELHRAAAILGMKPLVRFLRLYLPSTLSKLFSALRISTGIGIAVLFLAENYATGFGMGYFIMNNWVMINYPRMFAGILSLAILAALMLALIDAGERRLCPWIARD